jgi:hypothetical protein
MHLDSYFLERVVLPDTITNRQCSVLEQLYGLLSVTSVADEYTALPKGEPVYSELQSVANALTYEMYLREVEERPLNTDLTSTVAEILDDYNFDYEDWYVQHLGSESADEVESLFDENSDLFDTAAEVVDALCSDDIIQDMEAIADHPWVETIEQGHHRREETLPLFGPKIPE